MTNHTNNPPALFDRMYARIPTEKIVTLKYLLEGYEGLATLSTVDYEKSLVILKYYPGNKAELVSLLENSCAKISKTTPESKH